ncbi:MAG TPA: hypothetical protein VFV19_01545 [Candidatus Polarisedimenticolaceae bacterium]|nr:hypothetical protein [Candidatus Polarisedimenticolaceae bacterium]
MSHEIGAGELAKDQIKIPPGHFLSRVPLIGLGVGLAAAVLAYATAGGPREFAFSWLLAVLFCLSLALGGMWFVLIHYATQAGWGIVVRRLGENVMATMPLFALLFAPILLLMGDVFPWIHEQAEGHNAVLAGKAAFLNTSFFVARAVIYFVVWSAIALFFARASRRQDTTRDAATSVTLKRLAGPAIIVLALTQTFASIDWVMSLSPEWYSTMFGVYWFAGCFVSFFAFLTLLVMGLKRWGLMTDVVGVEHYHDLGKMIFAFTVFWAYIGFSQYFLIWYGNIPEETVFFRNRLIGAWSGVSMLLAVGHFIVPFFFLMPRTVKRNAKLLTAGAAWILFMHLVDVFWLIMPTVRPIVTRVHLIHLSDFFAVIAVAALFKGLLFRLLSGAPLVPVGDPRLPESLSFENM